MQKAGCQAKVLAFVPDITGLMHWILQLQKSQVFQLNSYQLGIYEFKWHIQEHSARNSIGKPDWYWLWNSVFFFFLISLRTYIKLTSRCSPWQVQKWYLLPLTEKWLDSGRTDAHHQRVGTTEEARRLRFAFPLHLEKRRKTAIKMIGLERQEGSDAIYCVDEDELEKGMGSTVDSTHCLCGFC